MASKVQIELNYTGFRQMLKSAEVQAALEDRMAATLSAAKATAPRASGEYADGLKMWAEQHRSRVVVRVGSDAPHALIVEANRGTLSRALDAAGGRRA